MIIYLNKKAMIHSPARDNIFDIVGVVVWGDTLPPSSEVPVMLELWGMWRTPLSLSLPNPLWPGVVAPDMALPMGKIKLICVIMLN